jgi:hypothetical protein
MGVQEDPMKRSRFTEDQIFAILKEADGGDSVPGGQVKVPHLWPGQSPPPGGTVSFRS